MMRLQQRVDGQRVELDLDGDAPERAGRVHVYGQRRVVGLRQKTVVVGFFAFKVTIGSIRYGYCDISRQTSLLNEEY